MKKVLLVGGCYFGQVVGGREYQQYLLGRALEQKGYGVYHLFVDNGTSIKSSDTDNLAFIRKRALVRRCFGPYFALDKFQVEKHLRRIAPDVIIARSGFAYVGLAACYAKRARCKMIWHIASESDVRPFHFSWKRSVLFAYVDKRLLAYGIKNANHIVGQARYQDRLLWENHRRRCDLIVPNFDVLPKHEIAKKGPIKAVWIANFKKCKQPEVFIRLAKEVGNHRDLRFIMIGRRGPQRWQSYLEREMSQVTNLEYLGEKPIDEVNRILCESHILVNTSAYEGFPNTFVQAWMRKVPVISLSVDPDDTLVREGIGFHSGNTKNMAKDLNTLVGDEDLRERMGRRARSYAFANHTVEKNVNKIVELF